MGHKVEGHRVPLVLVSELCVVLSVPTDPCVSDFLLTHRVFMPSSQLCPALQHQYPLMIMMMLVMMMTVVVVVV